MSPIDRGCRLSLPPSLGHALRLGAKPRPRRTGRRSWMWSDIRHALRKAAPAPRSEVDIGSVLRESRRMRVRRAVVALVIFTSACTGGDAQRPEGTPTQASTARSAELSSCVEQQLTALRKAARSSIRGIHTNVPLLRKLFEAAEEGDKKVTIGGQQSSVSGAFELATRVIAGDARRLRSALRRTC